MGPERRLIMETTQTASHPKSEDTRPMMRFLPGVRALERAYMAEILALKSSEIWLHGLEEGIKMEHDLFTALLGLPERTAALVTQLEEEIADAVDRGLAAVGE